MNMKMSNAALAYSFLIAAIVFVRKHICAGHKYFPLLLSCYYAPKIDHNVRERPDEVP